MYCLDFAVCCYRIQFVVETGESSLKTATLYFCIANMNQSRSYGITELRQQSYRHSPYYDLHANEAPASFRRDVQVYPSGSDIDQCGCSCCCQSCCRICISKEREKMQCAHEAGRSSCDMHKFQTRFMCGPLCTCQAESFSVQRTSFIRNSLLTTRRNQLENIMDEISSFYPMRNNPLYLYPSYQSNWRGSSRYHDFYRSAFKEHVSSSTAVQKPKRFQCVYCEKSFGKSSHLRDHVRTHTGERPFRCNWCNKAFTQYSNLRTHTRIHTGEKPYSCRYCFKSFTQAVTLRSHLRTHTSNDEKAN